MSLGARIEERLTALGINQSDLARKTKIPQTTVNSLVRAGRRSTPYLLELSRALETTPEYLSGKTDDPDADAPPAPLLTHDEEEWVDLYRLLRPKDRASLMQIGRSLAGVDQPGGTVHAPRPDYRTAGAG